MSNRPARVLAVAGAIVLCGESALASQPRVAVGVEGVEARGGEPLRSARVGLIAHAASVTWDGRHTLDVLRGLGIDVRRVFAPEHGWRGVAAAGEATPDDTDAGTPVVSLYGAKRRPAAADLRDLDALVFDLQDGGVRFYTYVSTMIASLQAASNEGLRFVVLDRPNPLGGERVEGPLRDEGLEPTFLSLAPGPLVHGLTAGEMANLVKHVLRLEVRLEVVPLAGWERGMTWRDTGRTWPMPSPNLRSAEAALAYPGVAFLEATNVSEGRGTDDPFLLLGAPWIDGEALAQRLEVPGYAFSPAAFMPRSLPWAPNPKHEGTRCHGVRIAVAEPRRASPFRLGLELLTALSADPQFQLDPVRLARLLGTNLVGAGIEAGLTAEQVIGTLEPEVETFRTARQAVLLYPRPLQRVDPSAAKAVMMLPKTPNQGQARSVPR